MNKGKEVSTTAFVSDRRLVGRLSSLGDVERTLPLVVPSEEEGET